MYILRVALVNLSVTFLGFGVFITCKACCKRDHSEELVETSNTQGNVMITEKCHSNTGVNKHTDGGRCCRGEIRKQSINGKIGIIDKLSTTSGSRNSKMSFVSALLTFPRILIKKPSSGDEMN